MQPILSYLVAGMFSWLLASSLWVYPHSLSYFNESIGGPLNGHKHLLGSNVDWGQDLIYLRRMLRVGIDESFKSEIYLAYFGIYSPGSIGLEFALAWPDDVRLRKCGLRQAFPESVLASQSTFAISVNLLRGLPHEARTGTGDEKILADEVLEDFALSSPVSRAGYSIHVYHPAVSVRKGQVVE